MGLVLAILGWTLLALLVLVIGALSIPWHVDGWGRTPPGPELWLRVRPVSASAPAFVRLRVTEFGRRGKGRSRARKRRGRPRREARPWLRRLGARAVRVLPDLVGDTLAGIHLDRLRLAGRVGLGDPAETGMLWGRLCPLLYGLPPGRVDVALEPVFDRAALEGEGEVALHVVPLRLAWPARRFLLREGRPWSAS